MGLDTGSLFWISKRNMLIVAAKCSNVSDMWSLVLDQMTVGMEIIPTGCSAIHNFRSHPHRPRRYVTGYNLCFISILTHEELCCD